VPAGRYWLVHRANEDFHLRETSYSDNAASILIRLTWHGGAAERVDAARVSARTLLTA